MAFWIRAATLVIGHNKYSLENMDFSFEIPFEDTDEPPVATIKVTNLAASTRAGIKRNDPVILNAGYEGDIGCLLVGKVVGLTHKQSNVDWVSTFTVQPCADEILGSRINKTYAKNTKASVIIRDLLNIFGVEVAKCELSKDKVYPRGRVCRGKMKQVLTEIIVNECKSRFIIRATGQIYITAANGAINNGVVLTSATGLLRSDEEKVTIPLETKENSQKKGKDREDDWISRSCILNYRIATAEQVKIQSKDLNGKFVVKEGKHSGSRTGKWETSMKLEPR
ncbi:hypothetical protein [uncultured Bacteroides sp.]|uniref:phage protein n=1 Tax=uncultured Bacteroides sp. TaxID=162156 RepID=UPI0025951C60|nr:hypothetical protein [uncultured Bacteroides sp.]